MKFAIFCLAVSLAAVWTEIDASSLLRKRSVDSTNTQNEANPTSGQTVIRTLVIPGQQPSQPVQPAFWPPPNFYPQPAPSTTTADPMCPEGKDKPCRELQPGQIGGITFQNNAWAYMQFYVEYNLRGQKIKKESGVMTLWMKKTIDIPTDAEEILVTIQNAIGPSDILKRQFKYPVIRCYATTDAVKVPEVGCA